MIPPVPAQKKHSLLTFDTWAESWRVLKDEKDVFDTKEWLDSAEHYMKSLLSAEASNRLALEHYIVPIAVLAGAVASRQGNVSILDFGGGIGVNYINVRAALPKQLRVQYDIVDSASNGERFESLLGQSDACRFRTRLDPDTRYDIVFASSTLQYISEWKQVLSLLGNMARGWLVLPRLPVTTGQTFAVRQQINFVSGPHSGKSAGATPHWIFNRDEIDGLLRGQGLIMCHDHFISDYGAEMTHLDQPAGVVTLRVKSFARTTGPSGAG